MIIDYSLLRGRIKQCGLAEREIALEIGYTPVGFSKVLKTGTPLRIDAVYKICEVLNIPLEQIHLYFCCQSTPKYNLEKIKRQVARLSIDDKIDLLNEISKYVI